MKKWQVLLKGHGFDLEELSENQQPTSWSIVKYDRNYYLESPQFSENDNTENITQKASDLLKLINGIARLKISNFRPVEMQNQFIQIDEKGNRHHFVNLNATIEARCKLKVMTPSIKVNGSFEKIIDKKSNMIDITLVEKDLNIRDAVRLFGKKDQNWSDLYKIYEIIRDDLGGHYQLLEKNYVPEKVIKNFTQTAQHPNAIGDEARHARTNKDAPIVPMAKRDAQDLISKLLSKWIESKQK